MAPSVVDLSQGKSTSFSNLKECLKFLQETSLSSLPVLLKDEAAVLDYSHAPTIRQFVAALKPESDEVVAHIMALKQDENMTVAIYPLDTALIKPPAKSDDTDINPMQIDPNNRNIINQYKRLLVFRDSELNVENSIIIDLKRFADWIFQLDKTITNLFILVQENDVYLNSLRESNPHFSTFHEELEDLLKKKPEFIETIKAAYEIAISEIQRCAQYRSVDEADRERLSRAIETENFNRELLTNLNMPSNLEAVQQGLSHVEDQCCGIISDYGPMIKSIVSWTHKSTSAIVVHMLQHMPCENEVSQDITASPNIKICSEGQPDINSDNLLEGGHLSITDHSQSRNMSLSNSAMQLHSQGITNDSELDILVVGHSNPQIGWVSKKEKEVPSNYCKYPEDTSNSNSFDDLHTLPNKIDESASDDGQEELKDVEKDVQHDCKRDSKTDIPASCDSVHKLLTSGFQTKLGNFEDVKEDKLEDATNTSSSSVSKPEDAELIENTSSAPTSEDEEKSSQVKTKFCKTKVNKSSSTIDSATQSESNLDNLHSTDQFSRQQYPRQIEILNQSNESLENLVFYLRRENTHLSQDIELLELKLKEKRQFETKSLQPKPENMSSQMDSQAHLKATLEKAKQQALGHADAFQKKLQDVSQELAQKESELEQLRKETAFTHANFENRVRSLLQEKQVMENRLHEYKEETLKFTETNQHLRVYKEEAMVTHEENIRLTQECEELRERLSDAANNYKKLDSKYNEELAAARLMKDDNAHLRKTVQEQTAAIEKLQQSLKEAQENSYVPESGNTITISLSEYRRLEMDSESLADVINQATEQQNEIQDLQLKLQNKDSLYIEAMADAEAQRCHLHDCNELIQSLHERLAGYQQSPESRIGTDSVLPEGSFRLVVQGDYTTGDVVLVHPRENGTWERVGDESTVIMDEYVNTLGLNDPSTPRPLPVQIIVVNDFGSHRGIEITRHLQSI